MIKILFAHPDVKLVQVYHPHLLNHFAIDSATDGLTALRKLKLDRPSLILSAPDLPRLSGLSLLKFVRSSSEYSTLPFMFLANSGKADEALSLGATDWFDAASVTPNLLIEKIYHYIKVYAI